MQIEAFNRTDNEDETASRILSGLEYVASVVLFAPIVILLAPIAIIAGLIIVYMAIYVLSFFAYSKVTGRNVETDFVDTTPLR